MNKNGIGETAGLYAFHIALVAVLLAKLLFGVHAIATNISFQQSYESKDIGLLLDTLYFSPHEAAIKYPTTQGFTYTIGNGKVSVAKENSNTYNYIEDKAKKIEVKREGTSIVMVKK